MRRLARFSAHVRIAIERPSGLIVDVLVEAGHHVFPIHPNAVKASRPRYRSHGAKSDASDAYLLPTCCAPMATAGASWRPQSDSIRALRALVRSRDDLVSARVALSNQLRSTLEAFWPARLGIFADISSPIGLAFCAATPRPRLARSLPKPLWPASARAAYSGRRSAAELLARLRCAATGLLVLSQRCSRAARALDGGGAAAAGGANSPIHTPHRSASWSPCPTGRS